MTADLQELLARVEKAEGPDRELDIDLACALTGAAMICEPLTASLDAALALVERALPTFTADLTIYRTNGGEFKPHSLARLFCPYGEIQEHRGDARSPALALLAAALRALISNTEAAG